MLSPIISSNRRWSKVLAFSNDYYGLSFRATQSVELFCAYHKSTPWTQKTSLPSVVCSWTLSGTYSQIKSHIHRKAFLNHILWMNPKYWLHHRNWICLNSGGYIIKDDAVPINWLGVMSIFNFLVTEKWFVMPFISWLHSTYLFQTFTS